MFPSSKNVLDKGCILEIGKREIAIKMMKNQMSLETIAQIAELPLEMLEKWRREYLDKE